MVHLHNIINQRRQRGREQLLQSLTICRSGMLLSSYVGFVAPVPLYRLQWLRHCNDRCHALCSHGKPEILDNQLPVK